MDEVSGLFTDTSTAPDVAIARMQGGSKASATQVISIMAGTSRLRNLCLCRVCYTESDYKHCTGLFTDSSNRGLTCRMNEFLQVSIEEGDGLPTMSCLGKSLTIELKIDSLRALAHSSCSAYLKSHTSVCTCKCPKLTSSIGISPTTSRVQPVPKRFQRDCLGKKLYFDQRGMWHTTFLLYNTFLFPTF